MTTPTFTMPKHCAIGYRSAPTSMDTAQVIEIEVRDAAYGETLDEIVETRLNKLIEIVGHLAKQLQREQQIHLVEDINATWGADE